MSCVFCSSPENRAPPVRSLLFRNPSLALASLGMATYTAASSSLMLTRTSAPCSQEFNPSLISLKSPILKLPSRCSLVLNLSRLRVHKYFSLYSPESSSVRRRSDAPNVVAAVSAEAEVTEEEVQDAKEGAVSTLAPPKPKTGKAALPLKRDRVLAHLSSASILNFNFDFPCILCIVWI